MNRVLLYAFMAGVLFLQAGCHRQRISKAPQATSITADTVALSQPQSTTTSPAPPDAVTTTAPVASTTLTRPGIEEARTNVAEIDFKYLTAKSKLSFKNKTQDISNANLNLRVRKDSVIWISISKLGIEAVRALITRDSVEIMDKLERRYAVYDFPTLSRQFNFDMNFDLLQALIVGNLPLPKRPAQKIKKERDYLLLRQSAGKVLVE
ncbi:MAG: DUF4292 domain-containing protein, partial [Cytophagaceae bacterium]